MDCDFLAIEEHGVKYEVITLSGKSGISVGLGTYTTKFLKMRKRNGRKRIIRKKQIHRRRI